MHAGLHDDAGLHFGFGLHALGPDRRSRSGISTWSAKACPVRIVSSGVAWTLPATARRVNTLPRIGRVKAHEPMGALTGRLADGRARLLGATVSRTAGRWYVSFTVEADREIPAQPGRGGAVGVDLGVRHLAVLSTGEQIPNPKHARRSERRLRMASRAYARSKPGSAGRRTRVTALGRIHARVAHQRRDGLHTLTTRLAKDHDVIVVEDLHVAGMVRNRRLARAISDVAMAEVRRQLDYKTRWYGSTLVVADRWYPSSKTCSSRPRPERRGQPVSPRRRQYIGDGKRPWSRPEDPARGAGGCEAETGHGHGRSDPGCPTER